MDSTAFQILLGYFKMHNYTIVIPNRFEEVIQPLLKSIATYEQVAPRIVIISDGHDRNYGYNIIRVDGKFIFSKSANLGIRFGCSDDIILLNDDVRLLQFDTFNTLMRTSYRNPNVGILTPIIKGGCGNIYMKADRTDLWKDNLSGIKYCTGLRGPDRVTFACVYIKRDLINCIGFMDENFVGYGYDDADYCIRTIQAGWSIAITNKTVVQHGNGGSEFVRGENWNTSFMKNRIGGAKRNLDYLMSKHPYLYGRKDQLKNERTAQR